jgi:hypothetical protein
MSDLDKFKELYKGLGIDLVVIEVDDDHWVNDGDDFERVKYRIILNDGYYKDVDGHTYSDKFSGYAGFISDICFDENGKFIRQGFWE